VIFTLFFLLLQSSPAVAYIPPAFFVYEKVAEQRNKVPTPTLTLSISRPLQANTEEVLGSVVVPVGVNGPETPDQAWPGLTLIFSPEAQRIVGAIEAFGIPVSKETDLLRAPKEQLSAQREPPKSYYRPDERMALRRLRKSVAVVHREGERSIWLEKDSFLPLKIVGPCPESILALEWVKGDSKICELEYRNIFSLRRGQQNGKILIWRGDQPVLFISVERSAPNKGGSFSSTTSSEITAALKPFLN
jgi:hypothetical protein